MLLAYVGERGDKNLREGFLQNRTLINIINVKKYRIECMEYNILYCGDTRITHRTYHATGTVSYSSMIDNGWL